jgi:hypothetical protein
MFSKKLLCLITAAATAGALVSCESEKKSALNYEQPLISMRGSLNYGDGDSYLSCYLPQEKARYTKLNECDGDFLSDIFNKDDYFGNLQIKVSDSRELSREELDELELSAQETYGTRFSFTKGQAVDADFNVSGKEEKLCDSRELTVVRYQNMWYIYGEVIDSFSFMPKS